MNFIEEELSKNSHKLDEVLNHPFLNLISNEGIEKNKFSYFIGQWYHLIEFFCPFLSRTISENKSTDIQTFLSKILYQELGSGKPKNSHLKLFIDTFIDAGLEPSVVNGEDERLEQTIAWVEGHRLAAKNENRGLGFVYGTEMLDLGMVKAVGIGATKATGISKLNWVAVHLKEEPDHTSCVNLSVDKLDRESQLEVISGVLDVWALWRDFFTGVSKYIEEHDEDFSSKEKSTC